MIKLAPKLALQPTAASATTAIVGIRGTGKTHTAVVYVEQCIKAGVQVVILDPLDVWWGLKSSKDGTKPGLEVLVMGGDRSDLPLAVEHAKTIADFVARTPVSAVLSLSHLRKGEQKRFVTEFLEELYQVKNLHRTPLLVVVDELSTFAPQRVMGEESRCLGAVEDIVRRGRTRGLGFVGIDQRPASINKDILTQLEILIAHRLTSPQDRAAIKSWVTGYDAENRAAEVDSTLTGLPRGEAWVWSPHFELFGRFAINDRQTFDSSATPEHGGTLVEPQTRSQIDIEGLRSKLSEVHAEAIENDPKSLKARVRELEALVAGGGDPEREAALVRRVDELESHIQQMESRVSSAMELLSPFSASGMLDKLEADDEPETIYEPQTREAKPMRVAAPVEGLTAKQQKMLDTLEQFQSLGVKAVDRKIVAVLSGQSPKSSAYDANLRALRAEGKIETGGDGVRLTYQAGKRTPPTFDDLHRAWHRVLSTGASKLFRVICCSHPRPLEREQLASLAGVSSKSSAYDGNLRELRSFGLIVGSKTIEATDLAYPRGLK